MLGAIKRAVDADPRPGQFVITGSVRADMLASSWPVTGRVIRIAHWGLTAREVAGATDTASIIDVLFDGSADTLDAPEAAIDLIGYVDRALTGQFPEVLHLTGSVRDRWLASYAEQLTARDPALDLGMRDPARLRRYLNAAARSTAGVPAHASLTEAAGVSRTTGLAYDTTLEALFVHELVPAWFSNRLKRLGKRPKRYLVEPAMLRPLAGVDPRSVLRSADLLGRLMDTFVIAQLRPELEVSMTRACPHHLRLDDGSHEVDLVLEAADGRVVGIEVKAAASVASSDARHLAWLRDQLGDQFVAGIVFHTGPRPFALGDRLHALPIASDLGPRTRSVAHRRGFRGQIAATSHLAPGSVRPGYCAPMTEVRPLTGTRVLDLTTGRAGAYAARLLVDAGADVVIVEPPDGTPLRRYGATPGSAGLLFEFLRGGTTSVTADLSDPGGAAFVRSSYAAVDLVLDDLGPGRVEALGLGAADLRAANPAAVMVSISPYGRGGPWSDRPGNEFTLQALAGGTSTRGSAEREYVNGQGRVGEWLTGAVAATIGLAAVRRARDTGLGEHVDLSMLEVINPTCTNLLSVWGSFSGATDAVRLRELPSIEPTADGYVGFCIFTGQQWQDFCVLIDHPELIADDSLATMGGRTHQAERVEPLIQRWTRARTTAEVVDAATALRIPVAPIGTGATVTTFEQFIARGVYRPHPTLGFLMPRPPYRIDGRSAPEPLPAPRLAAPPATDARSAASVADIWRDVPAHGEEATKSRRTGPGSPDLWPDIPSDGGDLTKFGRAGEGRAGEGRAGEGAAGERPAGEGPAGGAGSTPGPPSATLPLAGLRIVDLTQFWAGPWAGFLLAALGAEVIHVESIQRPDGMRFGSVKAPGTDLWWEWGPTFAATNRGKKSITLDLGRPEGRDLLRRLITVSDALIENYSPRVIEQFGLDWPTVHRWNDQLVMVRMPAFGLDGPWRDRVAFAQTMEQISGMAWVTGYADGPPLLARGPADPLAGTHAVWALLVALEQRRRTGLGAFVEATMAETALVAAAEQVIEHSATGTLLTRSGNAHPDAAFQACVPCRLDPADEITTGWLAVSAETSHQYERLQHMLAGEPLDTWASARDVHQAVQLLHAVGIPAAPVVKARASEHNDQMDARGFFHAVDHPVTGTHRYPGLPAHFTFTTPAEAAAALTPAPTLGQHNDEVLGGLLGLTAAELEALRDADVIGTRPLGT